MHDVPLVVLAAGRSSRFFPLGQNSHKGFFTIAGKSLLMRTLLSAYEAGVRLAYVVVSPKGSVRKNDYFLDTLPHDLHIELVEQREPLGMGDALLQLQEKLPEYFFVASPYHFSCGKVLTNLYAKQQETHCSCVLAGEQTAHPELYGIIAHEADRVTAIVEKPADGKLLGDIKVSSVYLLSKKYLQVLSHIAHTEYSFESALNSHCKTDVVCWVKNTEKLPTLKYSWHILELMQQILVSQKSSVDATAEIAKTAILDESKGAIVVGAHAVIKDFVKISGPSYIGEHVLVGEYTFIRESSLEKNARIGAKTEIIRSHIGPETSIHQSYCADSVLGEKTTIGAGLITANKRFDRMIVTCTVKDKKVSTDRAALGLITGEGVTLGVAVATMPGTLLASKSLIYPGKTINVSTHTEEKT